MVQVLCPVVVGRGAELAVINAGLDAALAGRGSCVVLTGEAGIGKSRLAREAVAQASTRGATTVTGRAAPAGATTAYRPLTEALQQALRAGAPDTADLAPWLPALAGIVPQFGSSGALADEPSSTVRGEALVQLLSRLARPSGLVVVLEDLHWADPDTLAIVEYLGDNLSAARVLLVVTIRSEEPSPALTLLRRQRGREGVVHLDLSRLSADDVNAMICACASEAAAALVDRVGRSSEGIPLLVEELLASPGVPTSFAEAVQQRLAQFDRQHRLVIEAAAILGRRFDWGLLLPMTGLSTEAVTAALESGVERLLLRVEEGSFRFRHALTREAILDQLLPPVQVALAQAGLAALDAAPSQRDDTWRDLAADLALRAGDRQLAGRLVTEAGRASLRQGALATAVEALGHAVELLERDAAQADAGLLLVEALALAGRVDEAGAAGRRAIDSLRNLDASGERQAEVHLRLAQAAVAAARWSLATTNLDAAEHALAAGTAPGLSARIAVLEAEVALAADDIFLARRRANDALIAPGSQPEVQCHALEVIGRIERFQDQAAARACFEQALAIADEADLNIWRVRALHELGTIDMFDHLGSERLEQARRSAEKSGALSTAAVVDLQLSAVFIAHWDPPNAAEHARSALVLAERLGLGEVRSKALLFLAEAAALLGEREQVEQYLRRSGHSGEEESPSDGLAWGFRGEAALASADRSTAIEYLGRATSILNRFAHAEPAAFRAMWPLLLASMGDVRAAAELDQSRRLGVGVFNLNRGLLGYADAILVGRAGDRSAATVLSTEADREFINCQVWAALARAFAAERAAADEWGEPARWLADGIEVFAANRLPRLAEWSRTRLAVLEADPWVGSGVTSREGDVLRLVADGLANKEIASRLRVSPRTVEKHIESLLRKTAARSRTQLAVWASERTTGIQADRADKRR